MAVSLDVKNAFNSLLFETLREAVRTGWFYGREEKGGYTCGASGVAFHMGPCWAPCCGMLALTGRTYEEAARLSTIVTSLVRSLIHLLGLRVSIHKTEALLFHGPRRGRPREARITLFGEMIIVKAQMKYLGLVLDGRWNFRTHFAQLAPKMVGAAAALEWLLPNVGGPGSVCRHLYSGIIRSMALYGAPVWVEALTVRLKPFLRRPQRVIAVRAIRSYRTVSWTAATLLSDGGGSSLWTTGDMGLSPTDWCRFSPDMDVSANTCTGLQRHSLSAVVGGDLSLSTIVGAMLDSQRCWDAMASFCESVLSHKEASERLKEDDPLRRRQLGRRRRHTHLLPPL
ncbi:uncharacterized protein LOC113233354 [Hyposmocoma kahamanoa]|uniref:uncharacterized protein LOC113233354 n=1 Tax=Hyposmocoma kahamanoa TaxID=1477025 RepID=UPI000E6D788C|nr:uncharacterized protein LOC113233354 [Hyposmocoma kahamanoa]